ncbi:MAG TPA: hypothetical protein VFU21_10730 [Kofleriaceae bacterium]|nr:hypothetical protein [Kofleriaceae bacterium]
MSGCPDCDRRRGWRWWLAAAVVVMAAVLLAQILGCSSRVVTIGPLEPRPRVALPPQPGRLALDLGRTADTLRVHADGRPPIEVRSVRRTMQAAFDRGLAAAFRDGARDPELTLLLEVTELGLVETRDAAGDRALADAGEARVVLVHGTHAHHQPKTPPRLRYARLSFRAVLRDRTGEIGRAAGRASSRKPARSGERDAIEACLVSAVEDLYQQIGRDLFLRRTAVREAQP